jgi:uncharacterized membrane protein YraQ (UPF0718 family)
VILGVIAGEALYYTGIAKWLERGARAHPAVAIPLASILGMASPLCTYGTVPVVLQLLRAGVPVAPMAAFLSTSSLMNPQLVLITWGGLGPKITVVRLASVLLFGLLFGTVTHFLPVRFSLRTGICDDQRPAKPRTPFTPWSFVKRSLRTLRFVGLYVVLGILLGAVVQVLVPGRWIVAMFGFAGWYQVLLAALLGVPLYACGGGVIPLVRAMLEQGMAGGAALAFLIAGPATRVAPLMAMATIVRPIFVVGYLVFLLVFSVLAGVMYGMF